MRSTNAIHLFLLVVLALVAGSPSARAVPENAPADPVAGSAPDAGVAAKRALPSPLEATNTCASCHGTLTDPKLRAPVKEFNGSAHRDERIGCAGCHKGDPRDPTAGAHGKSTGFEGHPTHVEVPGICGGCHSDANFMRRINGRIPVGQHALFQISVHGTLTASGDGDAPDCSTCHGKHNIISPSSPMSPVHRSNVAKLCGGCHADQKRMAKYELRTDQLDKWQKSVHGEAFRKGNPNAPTCTGCHGAHSAAPPDSASVAHACGRCHEEEMNFFEQSPHSKGFRQRGLAQCVACHGNHDVAPASATMVGTTDESTCMKCHSKDEKPRKVADDIAALLGGARDRATEARASVQNARDQGLHIAGVGYALDRVATAELRLRGVVHTLDPKRLEGRVAELDAAIDDTHKLVAEARARKGERRGYYIALALAGLVFSLLALKARQLDAQRSRESRRSETS